MFSIHVDSIEVKQLNTVYIKQIGHYSKKIKHINENIDCEDEYPGCTYLCII